MRKRQLENIIRFNCSEGYYWCEYTADFEGRIWRRERGIASYPMSPVMALLMFQGELSS